MSNRISSKRSKSAPYRLKCAQLFIDCNYADSSLSLQSVAARVGVTAPYLGKLFNSHCGRGFREVLKRVRLGRAAKLLGDPKFRIKEVASAVGYRHVSGFDRDFRAVFHKYPNEFRLAMPRSEL